MPSKLNTGHVIARYFASEDRIRCACGWEGDAEKPWSIHKKFMKDIGDVVPIEKQVLKFDDPLPMGISSKKTRNKKSSENNRMMPKEWEIMIDV